MTGGAAPFKIPESVLVVIHTPAWEVLLIRRIRELLYEQGFTISGARNQLHDHAPAAAQAAADVDAHEASGKVALAPDVAWTGPDLMALAHSHPQAAAELREALLSIRDLLS